MQFHPIANVFPIMDDRELDNLARSIKANGLIHPIDVYEDMILDGRNRYLACRKAEMEPRFVQWEGPDPKAYVLAQNRDHRHLDKSQLAMCAARLADLPQGGDRRSDDFKVHKCTLNTQSEAAERFDVSVRSVKTGRHVIDDGVPPLGRLVDTADVAVTLAGNVADLEEPEQHEFVARVQKGENPPAALREILRQLQRAKVAKTRAENPRQIDDPYDVIVIDPPWPMEKIERDIRPRQGEIDYPTMTLDEIKAMQLPAADDCHLWLWTTHRFLPDALAVLEAWEFRYVCTFVWHKPGGFQPVGLPQYNCEFALYSRKGTPKFVDTQAFNVCFDAPRAGHSAKPESFYEVVRRVTVGDRLDMFNRRPIDGFDTWGKEAK